MHHLCIVVGWLERHAVTLVITNSVCTLMLALINRKKGREFSSGYRALA